MNAESHPFASAILGAATVLLLGLGAYLVPDAESPCEQADRAIAARLEPILEWHGPDEARRTYGAVLTLKIAREYCARGWVEDGPNAYWTLVQHIDSHMRIGKRSDG
jgi:hypothetical protein